MHYELRVRLEPATHKIRVEGSITGLSSSSESLVFYLHENFNLHRLESQGKPVSWRMDPMGPRPPFDTVSRPVRCENVASELSFAYSGAIPSIINDINQIDGDIVELASYAGWYPKGLSDAFTFSIQLHLPADYRVASNGIVTYGDPISVDSAGPDWDIALFASPALMEVWLEDQDLVWGVLCPQDMLEQLPRIYREMKQATQFFAERYGALSLDAKHRMINVWRPRGGWGYRRGNTSFVSHQWVSDRLSVEFHELAHSWWGIADISTQDWINEGGAEYSAYCASRQIYGSSYAEDALSTYQSHAMAAGVDHSIAETRAHCPDRYTNHYEKTTLMLLEAERLYGEAAVTSLLRALFQRHRGTRTANAVSFLELAKDIISPKAAQRFEQLLTLRNWRQSNLKL